MSVQPYERINNYGWFPEFSDLDARIEYSRPQIRILRPILRMYSNSEVYRTASRSKYQEVDIYVSLVV